MIQRLLLLAFITLLLSVGASAQDEEAELEPLPVIPYYTSQENGQQFNVPIPVDWRVVADDEYIRMVNDDTTGEIYTIAVPSDDLDLEAAIIEGLRRINPEITVEERLTGRITIDGLTWAKDLYRINGGGDISAFARTQDGIVYMLLYINPDPDITFLMFAAENEDATQDIPVESAISEVFPEITLPAADATDDIRFADRVWTQSTYSLNDDTLHTLYQGRFGKLYLVMERGGDGATLETVNRALFTVLFGFFVTPENTEYLWLGLVASFFLIVVLIGSIYIRHQNAEKDLQMIESLQDD